MYARVIQLHAGSPLSTHGIVGSIGPICLLYLPCRMCSGPSRVSSVPWRATRVGKHESNVSAPARIPSSTEAGSAMPRMWLGFSGGTSGST